jgi:NADPH:quinone reductase-like Zn-dependent oxidoreductase
MKAIVIEEYGDVKTLSKRTVKTPQPKDDEVLVEIHATGMNPIDYKMRNGDFEGFFNLKLPGILGADISGTVKETGKNVLSFEKGDEVFWGNPLDKDGGYAQYVVVNQSLLARKPQNISHVEAASFPVVAYTSIQAFRDYAKIKPGSKVLIHAGAGGIGSFAIQYAKFLGAEVFTTASKEKHEYLKKLGADHTIDYKSESFVNICQEAGGMDVVLETLGGKNLLKSLMATKTGGIVPNLVDEPSEESKKLSLERNIKTKFFLLQLRPTDLDYLSKLIKEEKVFPTVSEILKFDEISKGQIMLESGRTKGKIVVKLK